MGIPVDPKPKNGWKEVQRKKATCQGTKSTMVSCRVPATNQIPHDIIRETNTSKVTTYFRGILEMVSGTQALLQNNDIKIANWSVDREFFNVTFTYPIDMNLWFMTHKAII